MRICVVGGGLAGAALAWRVAGVPGCRVDLLAGGTGGTEGTVDATGVSAGAVRAYEPSPAARCLATESMRELLDSPVLRRWGGFHECGFTYLRHTGAPDGSAEDPANAVAEIDRLIPGSARTVPAGQLHRRGWQPLPGDADAVAVVEQRAGHLSPDRLRGALLADLRSRSGAAVRDGQVDSLEPRDGDGVRVGLRGGDPAAGPAAYDLVVVAAGAWTPALLRAAGLPGDGLRTKAIQYVVYEMDGWCPSGFVDEVSGLYGRATHDGGMLLGLPSQRWDVCAGGQQLDRQLRQRAREVAGRRLPSVRPVTQRSWVAAADCYADAPGLALRPVPGAGGALYTFTGGSGGSVKSVLAASARAAATLTGRPDPLHAHAHPHRPRPIRPAATRPTRPPIGQRSDPMSDPVTAVDRQPGSPTVPHFHAVGVGAGPSNLSLAALYASATSETIALFDRSPGPQWHPTLLYPGVRMQTGWLKDLVSLVDPKHELTFLNYLVSTGRLYALLNAQFDAIPRIEYQRYLSWAAQQLPNVQYGVAVDQVSFTDGGFVVRAQGRPLARADHLVIGVGTRPFVPEGLSGLPEHRAFLADDVGERLGGFDADDRAAPVAVVGGGQTGIEAVFRLLGAGFTDIRWFGRQQWFQSIDDSPVANDVYRPAHLAFLQRVSRPTRRQLIAEHRLTGDALTPGALKALYQANYDGMLELGRFPVALLPGRDVTDGRADADEVVLRCTTSEGREEHRVRHVVIATGREHVAPPLDDDLRERIDVDDDNEMIVEPDFSVRWKGMNGHRIFALNHSRYSHGLTNAGLTLLPVRAAMVLNSLFGREIYEIRDELCPVRW